MLKVLPIALLALAVSSAGIAGADEAAWPSPLTDQPGDAARGLALVRDSSLASCLICHSIDALPDRDQGELGPPLDGVAEYLEAGQFRQRIMDARKVSPGTIMPPYYSTEGLFRVGAEWVGQTIYSAQDVEDVVAYLLTLKD